MGDSIKIQKYLDDKELALFFRDLADGLENGGKDELACVEDFRKIKIGIKKEFGRMNLKVRVKPADGCEDAADGDEGETPSKPKYSHLKKRMKSSFRLLRKTIADGQVPPAEAVDSFLADSRLMLTYPGCGDEYYASYAEACGKFDAAFRSGDLARMQEAVDALTEEKNRCHAKYD